MVLYRLAYLRIVSLLSRWSSIGRSVRNFSNCTPRFWTRFRSLAFASHLKNHIMNSAAQVFLLCAFDTTTWRRSLPLQFPTSSLVPLPDPRCFGCAASSPIAAALFEFSWHRCIKFVSSLSFPSTLFPPSLLPPALAQRERSVNN